MKLFSNGVCFILYILRKSLKSLPMNLVKRTIAPAILFHARSSVIDDYGAVLLMMTLCVSAPRPVVARTRPRQPW